MKGKKQYSQCLLNAFNLAYDIFAVTVNLTDMASDIVICVQFGLDKRWVFFGLCIFVLIIGQICYALLFIVIFVPGNPENHFCRLFLSFLLILPFAQLVPSFVWLNSYHFECVDNLITNMGLNTMPQQTYDAKKDPLKNYIQKKFQTHGGFIIEAMVESVPQSIIQMIAIVISGQVYPLSVVSIIISIVSVASKGFMLSYCIDRYTAAFNFLCFVTDVFGIFTVVSWVFFHPPNVSTNFPVFFMAYQIDDFATQIWFYKEFVAATYAFGLGLFIYFSFIVMGIAEGLKTNNWENRIKGCFGVFCFFFFGLFLYGPWMVMAEGITLSMIPLLAFNSLHKNHRNPVAVSKLYGWLNKGNFTTKVLTANRYFAKKLLKRRYINPSKYTEIMENHMKKKPLERFDDYQVPTACAIVSMTEKNLTLSELKKYSGISFFDYFVAYSIIVEEEAKDMKKSGDETTLLEIAWRIGCYIGIPIWFLSGMYNLVYPIISFIIVPFADISLLQKALSIIYFICIFLLIILAYPVHKYQRIQSYLFVFNFSPDEYDVSNIINNYSERRLERVRNNTIRISLLITNGRHNLGNPLIDSICTILPMIEKFAGISSEHSINVSNFLNEKLYKKEIERHLNIILQEEKSSTISISKNKLSIGNKDDKTSTGNCVSMLDQTKTININENSNHHIEVKKEKKEISAIPLGPTKMIRSVSAPEPNRSDSIPRLAGVIPQPIIIEAVGNLMSGGMMTWKHTALMRSISKDDHHRSSIQQELNNFSSPVHQLQDNDVFLLPPSNPILDSAKSAPI